MIFEKNGNMVKIDDDKKLIKIIFKNEKEKKDFDNNYLSFILGKHKGYTLLTEVMVNKKSAELVLSLKNLGYEILDSFRPYLKKEIKTIGKLLEFEQRETSNGSLLSTFYFKVPGMNRGFKGATFSLSEVNLKKGSYFEIFGKLKKDQYYKNKKIDYELGYIDFVFDIKTITELSDDIIPKEIFEKPRAELHLHTVYSGKDAFIDSNSLREAYNSGKLSSAAITDHGVIYSLPYLKKELKDIDMPLYVGIEAYLIDDELEYRKKSYEIAKIKALEKISLETGIKKEEELNNLLDELEIKEMQGELTEKEIFESIVSDGERNHAILLLKTKDSEIEYKGEKIKVNEGIKILNSLITRSYKEGFSEPKIKANKFWGKRPCILKSWLKDPEVRKHFVLGSACIMGEIGREKTFANEKGIKEKMEFYDYVEIMPLSNDNFLIGEEKYPAINCKEDIYEINKKTFNIAKEMGKKVIFTSDAHVMNDEEKELRMRFKQGQIGQILKRNDPENVDKVYEDFTLENQPKCFSYEEKIEELKRQGFTEEEINIMDNDEKEVTDSLVSLKEITLIPDHLFVPEFPGVNVKEEVPKLAWEFAKEKWGDALGKIPKEIEERLQFEIEKTAEKNYEFLYYVSKYLVDLSKNRGYTVGSRGSVGSSLLAYSLGVTTNNPLKPHYHCSNCNKVIWVEKDSELEKEYKGLVGWDLPNKICECGSEMKGDGLNIAFESFTGLGGLKVPDVDLNFAGDVQKMVQEEVVKLFGEEHTSASGTIKFFGEDQLKQNILSNIPRIVQHIATEELDLKYMSKSMSVRESTGKH